MTNATIGLRKQISEAIADEQSNPRMGGYLKTIYRDRGTEVAEHHIQEAIKFIFNYIRSVPVLLESFDYAASQAGKSVEIQSFISSIASYFSRHDDYVSDRYGLFGLLDDAFFACKTIEYYDDAYYRKTGQNLIQDYDIQRSNTIIANILGQNISTRIVNDIKKELSSMHSKKHLETVAGVVIGGLLVGAFLNQLSNQANSSYSSSSSSSGYWEDDMASGMAEIQSSLNRARSRRR
jgi:hypothetical protein